MPRPSRREHIVDTAIRLFCKNGFHATGVDMIMREAKISKKTLYNHFRSKDELILAALRHYDGVFRNDFIKQVEKRADEAGERLLAIFDILEEWFNGQDFYGCMFINAMGEFSAADSPLREACKQYKQLMMNYIKDLCEQLAIDNAAQLAEKISLLLEGATVTAQVSQCSSAAKVAKESARIIINSHLN